MELKNNEIQTNTATGINDVIHYEKKDFVSNFDALSTTNKINSIICTPLGVTLDAHPLIIFKDKTDYYYLKCRSAYSEKKHKQRKKLKTEIQIVGVKGNSVLKHASYVDTAQLFSMSIEKFQKYCKEKNIEYWELNGDHIAKNKQEEIISKLTENTKSFPPKISYFHVDIDEDTNEPKFIPIFCDKKILKHEKKLFKAKIPPYNWDNEEQKQELIEIANKTLANIKEMNKNLRRRKNVSEEKADLLKVMSFFNALGAGENKEQSKKNKKDIPEDENIHQDEYFIFNKKNSVVGLTELGKQQEKLVIPKDVNCLWGNVLRKCKNLKQVFFEEGTNIKYIDSYAFRNCGSLKEINIPNSVIKISHNAFQNCTALEKITIPNNVTKIDRYAFNGCRSLQQINLPNNIPYIGENAFQYCTALEEITIPNSVTSINENAFNECKLLKKVTFEDESKLTYINMDSFRECNSLKEITIPKSVKWIGPCAFQNCIALQSVTFEKNSQLEEIGEWAFADCKALEDINIPKGVKEINISSIFDGCKLIENKIQNYTQEFTSHDQSKKQENNTVNTSKQSEAKVNNEEQEFDIDKFAEEFENEIHLNKNNNLSKGFGR